MLIYGSWQSGTCTTWRCIEFQSLSAAPSQHTPQNKHITVPILPNPPPKTCPLYCIVIMRNETAQIHLMAIYRNHDTVSHCRVAIHSYTHWEEVLFEENTWWVLFVVHKANTNALPTNLTSWLSYIREELISFWVDWNILRINYPHIMHCNELHGTCHQCFTIFGIHKFAQICLNSRSATYIYTFYLCMTWRNQIVTDCLVTF